jgi:hypothetical protein
MTPRFHFFRAEGAALRVILWGTTALFLTIMVVTWVLAERARPVFLDLQTGKPVAKKPAL